MGCLILWSTEDEASRWFRDALERGNLFKVAVECRMLSQ